MADLGSNPVTLVCPDHHATLVRRLYKFFTARHGVDFDVQLVGQSIRAHQLVVEAFLTCEEEECETKLQDESSVLDCVFEFMYTGTVTVCREQLFGLVEIAKELDFTLLVDAVNSAMAKVDARCSHESRKTRPNTKGRIKGDAVGAQSKTKRLRKLKSTESRARLVCEVQPVPASCYEDGINAKISVGSDPASRTKEPAGEESLDRANRRRRLKGKSVDEMSAAGAESVAGVGAVVPTKRKKERRPLMKCDLCDFQTRYQSYLKIHRYARHDPSAIVWRCQACKRRFLDERLYHTHPCTPKERSKVVHRCPHCAFTCSRKNRYHEHLAGHDSSLSVWKCDDCFRPFPSQESLEEHKAKHRTYRCTHCEFETKMSWRLYTHLYNIHSITAKGKPVHKVACNECDFSCLLQRDLITHKVSEHSGEKPFKCPQCPYSAARKTAIAVHTRRAHDDLKPYMCETCGLRAVSPYNLAQHRKKHTGEREFVCQLCGNSFIRRYHLKVHLRNVHSHEDA